MCQVGRVGHLVQAFCSGSLIFEHMEPGSLSISSDETQSCLGGTSRASVSALCLLSYCSAPPRRALVLISSILVFSKVQSI